tara:strand:+ start:465 stop:1616 length:1152 start_codon:yes stop_codon:yes gene_type:complete
MANTFKNIEPNDVISTRTLLHEAIPLTGTIVSGTYGTTSKVLGDEENVKNFSHGMFQSVYDYPYLSSSANHIFDITVGYADSSALSSSANAQNAKKINLYNQMAQVCMGYDKTGSIQLFDEDGDLASGTKMKECMFFNFSRLLVKDEIKKGSFQLELGIHPDYEQNTVSTMNSRIKITDYSGSNGYKTNSPVGEYGVLFATCSTSTFSANTLQAGVTSTGVGQPAVGLIFYQAGIAVISGSIFSKANIGGILNNSATGVDTVKLSTNSGNTGFGFVTGSQISSSADAIRNRIYNIQFNNTTELNSTIYFCRVNHNEYNYSGNPTYLSSSKIVVKDNIGDQPISYITSVGLYSADGALMAVGKLSEPLRKDPSIEYTLRARLDY